MDRSACTSPELVDENGNGYPDFFEVSQGVDTNAYNGAYHFSFPVGSGAIWTTWFRPRVQPRDLQHVPAGLPEHV